MEQMINKWVDDHNLAFSRDVVSRLLIHAEMVFDGNQMFNLTGFKTIEEIIINLELESILPFAGLSVPRGTRVADCGTGAGYPGVPFAIINPDVAVVMFDSSEKKCDFIGTVIETLGIANADVVCGRIEDLGRTEYRDSFDLVMSRAMAQHYVAIEITGSLVRQGGCLYLYGKEDISSLHSDIVKHANDNGLLALEQGNSSWFAPVGPGYAFYKNIPTPEKYPRNYPVIKRESKKYE